MANDANRVIMLSSLKKLSLACPEKIPFRLGKNIKIYPVEDALLGHSIDGGNECQGLKEMMVLFNPIVSMISRRLRKK